MALAAREGWRITALAREGDADFVARAGAELVTELPGPTFDVLDGAVLLESAPAAVADGAALAEVLALAVEGTLEVRVDDRVPLREAGRACDEVARGGHRGRWLLIP